VIVVFVGNLPLQFLNAARLIALVAGIVFGVNAEQINPVLDHMPVDVQTSGNINLFSPFRQSLTNVGIIRQDRFSYNRH